jgi:hypothetical protein
MSTTTPHTDVPQLIEQRLDAIDQALAGLLPRHDRLVTVAQIESRIREVGLASAAINTNTSAAPQLLVRPESASSNLALQTAAFQPQPQFIGMPSGGWVPATPKKRSRLAISAAVVGIVALLLLMATPVTYFIVAMLEEVLGEVVAIALMAMHGVAIAGGGLVAVVLGICAIVILRRRKDQLAGFGWAIAGLCTGALPMMLGCTALLLVGLQFGVAAIMTAFESNVVSGPVHATVADAANETAPARAGVGSMPPVENLAPSYYGSNEQPVGLASHSATVVPGGPAACPSGPSNSGLVPPPECLPSPVSGSAPSAANLPNEPQPATRAANAPKDAEPAPRPDSPAEPVAMPESAPSITR